MTSDLPLPEDAREAAPENSPSDADAPISTQLIGGRYVLVDLIADGGVGSVWRAWDCQQGIYVAAKLLRPQEASVLLRFVREQSLRIEHPHVVTP
ncbi:MAG: hypothetical protein ACRDTD_28175 [Pseudonocardiaceae bacterium]